jgi:RING-variant domain
MEKECRICTGEGNMIVPCACKGTQGYVHKYCIEYWIRFSRQTHCSICSTPWKVTYIRTSWDIIADLLEVGNKILSIIVCLCIFGCMLFFLLLSTAGFMLVRERGNTLENVCICTALFLLSTVFMLSILPICTERADRFERFIRLSIQDVRTKSLGEKNDSP